MKNYFRISILLFFCSVYLLHAGIATPVKTKKELHLLKPMPISGYLPDSLAYLYSDTISMYQRGSDGLIIMPPVHWIPFSGDVSFRDTVIYDPAFLPVIFDGKILPSNLDFLPKNETNASSRFHLIPQDSTFAPLLAKIELVNQRRKSFYTNNIEKMRYNISELKSIPKIDDETVTKRNVLNDLITADEPIRIPTVDMQKIDHGFIYWVKTGEHSLQLAQSYISDNWQGGGNPSFYVKNYHKMTANYKKDKLEFNNIFEWRLNLQQTQADTLHDVSVSDDLFRIYSTLGYKAFNRWTYSANLETTTPIFNRYSINSESRKAALLSPLRFTLGLGMNYTLDKKFKGNKSKKLKIVQSISPLAIDYRYTADEQVFVTNKVEKKSDLTLGSSLNTDLQFDLNRYMSLTSRLKYLTNYERVEVEFENTFNMLLNRYLSAKIYFYLRYDDDKPPARGWGHLQRNEALTFGLNYKW